MLKIATVYGALAGAIVAGLMLLNITLLPDHGSASLWIGYLTMILALSMIFFGVKRYRDRDLGGVIKFVPAFLMGVCIAIVAGVLYAIGWEAYLAATGYKFAEAYADSTIKAKEAEGVSGAALDALIAQMEAFKTQYANPLYRLAMTFMEIFPVGLVIALISAAVLRNPNMLPARKA